MVQAFVFVGLKVAAEFNFARFVLYLERCPNDLLHVKLVDMRASISQLTRLCGCSHLKIALKSVIVVLSCGSRLGHGCREWIGKDISIHILLVPILIGVPPIDKIVS